jgi:phosphatidylserine decarboxylase
VSRAVQNLYVRAYSVDMADVEPSDGPYASFDAFFTRPLRSGARNVDRDPVVCPADGRLEASGRIDAGSRIFVKGRPYDVGELVGDARDARRYAGGSFAVVYLSPRDYHRVHAPVDGEIGLVRGIRGDLYPVNSIGERYVPRLFVRNKRVAIAIDTDRIGRVTVVMVGAVIVGRISVSVIDAPSVPEGEHHIEPAVQVHKGDEIGVFHLGSTAVVLLEPGLELSRGAGAVRYGESMSRAG